MCPLTRFAPTRRPMAMDKALSSSLRPTADRGRALSQSPEPLDMAARYLLVEVMFGQSDRIFMLVARHMASSHILCFVALLSIGSLSPPRSLQWCSACCVHWSLLTLIPEGSRTEHTSVALASEARNAQGASLAALRTPNQPHLIGRVA